MTQPPTYDSHSLQPRSQTDLEWKGKDDEYGNQREVSTAVDSIPMQQIYERLNITPQQLKDFCQQWQLSEIALFGSVLRKDFRSNGEDSSDVDVLFTYGTKARRNLLLQSRMKFELEDLFQRPVDLVSKTAILADPNYIRRQNILESARVIYVEG